MVIRSGNSGDTPVRFGADQALDFSTLTDVLGPRAAGFLSTVISESEPSPLGADVVAVLFMNRLLEPRSYDTLREMGWLDAKLVSRIDDALALEENPSETFLVAVRRALAPEFEVLSGVSTDSAPVSAFGLPGANPMGRKEFGGVQASGLELDSMDQEDGFDLRRGVPNDRLDPVGGITPAGVPSNDTCANAIALTIGAAATAGDTFSATPDPPVCGSSLGTPSGVWYSVVGNGQTLTATLCPADGASASFDTVLAIYCGTCTAPICVANNDQFCGNQSRVSWCSANGTTYRILVRGWDASQGTFSVRVLGGTTCSTPASCAAITNDTCGPTNPLLVPGVPMAGSNIGATADPTFNAIACGNDGTPNSQGPGVFYRLQGTGRNMTVGTCGGTMDTVVQVFCGSCTIPFCAIGNDDACAPGSSVTFCTSATQEYIVLVTGWLSATGNFTVLATDSGVSCTNPPLCAPCTVSCPAGATLENEPNCGLPDTINGGANSAGCPRSPLACGQTYCSTMGTGIVGGLQTRDTDWYSFTLTATTRVTWCATFEHLGLIGLIDGCGTAFRTFTNNIAPCVQGCTTADLPPGNYSAFAAPAGFTGVPCGSDYTATFTCQPLGACCNATALTCTVGTLTECNATGGEFLGSGTNCTQCFGACCLPSGNHACTVTTASRCGLLGGGYLGAQSSCTTGGSFVWTPNTPIPDAGGFGNPAIDTRIVTESFDITDVNVDFATTHTWVGDLNVELVHGSQTVRLINRPLNGTGGCASNGYDIILDDEAALPVNSQCAVGGGQLVGTFRPGASIPPPGFSLTAFDGLDSAGAWTIRVSDHAGADLGTIQRWSLHIGGGPPACNLAPSCFGGGPYTGDCTTVVIDGASASDPDNDPLTYEFSSGDENIVIVNGSGVVAPDGSIAPAIVILNTEEITCAYETTITLTVSDGLNGGTTTCDIQVVFADQDGPTFTRQPQIDGQACNQIWPPDHAYVDYSFAAMGAQAVDNCGGAVTISLVGCESSQPEDDRDDTDVSGDGNTLRDCIITPTGVSVRAERTASCDTIGRVYTVTIAATDQCGNVSLADPLEICVYHDRGHAPAGPYRSSDGSGSSDARFGVNGTYNEGCGSGCTSCGD